MIRNSTEASSVQTICELFRDQFSSTFSDESLHHDHIAKAASNVPRRASVGPHPAIHNTTILKACAQLKKSTNAGPDGIPSIVLKKCSTSLCPPLLYLFNKSLTDGVFPNCWKKSFIFPVFKKGCKRDVQNYRGIAALCSISKLFELIVLEFMFHSCSSYIVNEQHGFVPKRSTVTNLVCYTSYIARSIQQGFQIDAIYTDLSAAFDKINHQIAIAKLERLGFHGSFLKWIESYMIGREMLVKIGDIVSCPFSVSSGVPQGSHLGPLIFLLYLNDVNFSLSCLKLSYADDFKLFARVSSTIDASLLQQQLNVFSEWCSINRMLLNATKCSVISFSRKRSPVSFNYKLNGITLKRESVVKDLGIMLDSKLTFANHIEYITSKASKTLGFVFRITKQFRDIQCLKTLFCTLVRSTLEYASVVWAPYYANSIRRIERVQRKFVRFALRNLPWRDPQEFTEYNHRCRLIGLDLLSQRREVAKATFITDLIKSNIDCPDLLQQLNINIRHHNLRTSQFFHLPVARTNYGYHEPFTSMCRVFNRCSAVFDFHLSRPTLKKLFLRIVSSPEYVF